MAEDRTKENNILSADLEHEMKSSYLDYSMSVIVGRALPDARDGLKPVQRRILYDMNLLGLTPGKPYRKSARLVGDVMGRFHPHGDSAIYDAVVHLAQPFNMRYPLADGQGNYGSIDGDSAAAMRYTEVRMTKLAQEMLRDLNKDTVDRQPNFDEEEEEPVVLPSRFPNLLVNGTSGIAVGMATNMPPHNLKEAINACIAYMHKQDISLDELMEIIPGPDFPTGAHIMGTSEIRSAYKTGRGKIKMRAVAHIEPIRGGRNRIIVTEIPYQVNKARLIQKIAELVRDKKLEGISDIRDDTNRTGIRIVIDLKRDAIPKVVLNNLYKKTQMETSFGVINLALVEGKPKLLSLKDMIACYIRHQEEVVTRRTRFDLARAEARAHIIEGLQKAIDHIDEIIRIIRSSYSTEEIKKIFLERFGLDDLQSQAILDMQLKKLSGLERDKLEEEYQGLLKDIARYKEILSSEKVLMGVIEEELVEIRDQFGDERRTRIMPEAEEINIEDLIKEEDMVISMTRSGYIKRTPVDKYKIQHRGGVGIKAMTTKEDDHVTELFIVSTHEIMLFFTNMGKVYQLNAYEIPEGSRTARGSAIVNMLALEAEERVEAIFPLSEKDLDQYFIFITRQGTIKKCAVDLFSNIRANGLKALTLKEGDELEAVRLAGDRDEVIIVTRDGMSIYFSLEDIRPIGREGMGVKGISLGEGDAVIDMDVVGNNDYLLVVSEKGYGKKTLLKYYSRQNRGGKGLISYKASKKTGKLVAGMLVKREDEVMLISTADNLIRINVDQISTLGRATSGVKLKNLASEEDRIVAVAKNVDPMEEEEEEES